MNNWNTLFDKAKDVANLAGKKTEEVVETSKLKLQSFSINSDIQDAYEKIGGLVYRARKTGVNNEEEIAASIAEIDELLSALNDLESKIAEIKKVKKCPNCGANCSSESHFCSRCGMVIDKQDIVVYSEEPQNTGAEAPEPQDADAEAPAASQEVPEGAGAEQADTAPDAEDWKKL